MAQISLQIKDLSRYQIEYPLYNRNSNSTFSVQSSGPLEAFYTTITIQDTDQASFTFDKTFTDTPIVIAGLVTQNSGIPAPNINVYVESVTKSGGVIRTSAPVTSAQVAIHAIYTGA